MANKFVWSGATGANDGSTWEDAYTSLMRDWSAEAGFTPATDVIYVRDSHAESTGAALTLTGMAAEGNTEPARVYCVVGNDTGTTPGARSSGASVTTSGVFDIILEGGHYIDGVDFFSGDDIFCNFSGSLDLDASYELCRFELTSTTSGGDRIYLGGVTGNQNIGRRSRFKNCTFDFGHASQGFTSDNSTLIEVIGGSVAFNVDNLFQRFGAGGRCNTRVTGFDLSIMTGTKNMVNIGTAVESDSKIRFERCLLPSGITLIDTDIDAPGMVVEAYHCQNGTDSDPAYQMEILSDRGRAVTDTARYRTGGASDGERTNPISWDLDTVSGSKRQYPGHAFETPPIAAWTDGDASTAHTYRIYFASDATINDDEIWFELEGPNDAATDSLAVINTSRVAPGTSASAYTTDGSSTWTGSGVGTKQQMDITYTPDKPGPVIARIYVAKDSDNIYVDPQIVIDP
jgi:hypothetical protein